MTELGGMTISERAKRLIEALHELSSNEARWMVAQTFLDEEAEEAIGDEALRGAATPVTPVLSVTKTANHSKDGGEGSVP